MLLIDFIINWVGLAAIEVIFLKIMHKNLAFSVY